MYEVVGRLASKDYADILTCLQNNV